MSKHTPGPWVWTNGTDPIDVAIYEAPGYYQNPELRAGGETIVGCDEYWTIGPWGNREQMVANAALIAAAPEMLEALHEARLQLEYLAEKFQPTGSGVSTLAKINAAIAKAGGQS